MSVRAAWSSSLVRGARSRTRSAAAMSSVPVPQAGSMIRRSSSAFGARQSRMPSEIASDASRVAAAVVV